MRVCVCVPGIFVGVACRRSGIFYFFSNFIDREMSLSVKVFLQSVETFFAYICEHVGRGTGGGWVRDTGRMRNFWGVLRVAVPILACRLIQYA